MHRAALTAADVRRLGGIPVTSPARTILDMAAAADPHVESALARALRRNLTTRSELLERASTRPGCRLLLPLLDSGPALTESEAESRLLALIRKARLPEPECNITLGRFVVDFLWRPQRLVVEVDGFEFHSDRATFESDRVRDAELQAMGFRVLRVTWRGIVREAEAVIARIAGALARDG